MNKITWNSVLDVFLLCWLKRWCRRHSDVRKMASTMYNCDDCKAYLFTLKAAVELACKGIHLEDTFYQQTLRIQTKEKHCTSAQHARHGLMHTMNVQQVKILVRQKMRQKQIPAQCLLLTNVIGVRRQHFSSYKSIGSKRRKLNRLACGRRCYRKKLHPSCRAMATVLMVIKLQGDGRLIRGYKNVKDHNSKSGNNPKIYEYEQELDNIFGDDPNVMPKVTNSSL